MLHETNPIISTGLKTFWYRIEESITTSNRVYRSHSCLFQVHEYLLFLHWGLPRLWLCEAASSGALEAGQNAYVFWHLLKRLMIYAGSISIPFPFVFFLPRPHRMCSAFSSHPTVQIEDGFKWKPDTDVSWLLQNGYTSRCREFKRKKGSQKTRRSKTTISSSSTVWFLRVSPSQPAHRVAPSRITHAFMWNCSRLFTANLTILLCGNRKIIYIYIFKKTEIEKRKGKLLAA